MSTADDVVKVKDLEHLLDRVERLRDRVDLLNCGMDDLLESGSSLAAEVADIQQRVTVLEARHAG